MIRRAQPWLGTLVDIRVDDATDDGAAHHAAALAFAEVALVQRLMSFHDPDSEVSRLNRAAPGETLAVHPHTWRVLELAQRMADASGGAFNIACAPRLVAWNVLPAPHAGAPAYQPGLPVVRCEAGDSVRKLNPGWIDLGGIAKGYAVDLAIEALRAAGVRSACVNAGGDLRVLGATPCPVSIRSPRDPGRTGAQLILAEEALATSAGYFSSRTHAGRQVCALVDGRDGEPVTAAVSVSVRAPTCAVADALTKIVLASGDSSHPALAAFGASALII